MIIWIFFAILIFINAAILSSCISAITGLKLIPNLIFYGGLLCSVSLAAVRIYFVLK